MKPLIELEENFNILQNESGDLLILIRARLEDANHPTLVYDKGEHAFLYRNDHNTVILDYIHPVIRKALRLKKQVLIVETNNGAVFREYKAKVNISATKLIIPEEIQQILSSKEKQQKTKETKNKKKE